MGKSNSKKLRMINDKLEQLTDVELSDAENFIDALFTKEERPYDHYLGRFLEIDKSGLGYKMRLGKNTENTYKVAQGGAVFSLADIAIGFHLMELLEDDVKVFTLELKMNFMKAGKGHYLYAYPEVLHLGNTTAVTECFIQDDEGATVAKALGTFYLKR